MALLCQSKSINLLNNQHTTTAVILKIRLLLIFHLPLPRVLQVTERRNQQSEEENNNQQQQLQKYDYQSENLLVSTI